MYKNKQHSKESMELKTVKDIWNNSNDFMIEIYTDELIKLRKQRGLSSL